MRDFLDFFKDKKVTVVGLGLLGKRLGDIAFLSECGAEVLVTDLKPSAELRPSLDKLREYKSIKYVLGEHRFEDFENCDFVLKGQGVAFDSPYIAHAREKGIPIEMDESLFAKISAKLFPRLKMIGVTGTRGKSTTTLLIYEILKQAGMRVHLGGNIQGTAALPLLDKVKDGDLAVFELSSWQLQGFGDARISPHISVFTNFMPDHMNYYQNDLNKYFKDKSFIYEYQKEGDSLILGPSMKDVVKDAKGKIINADIKNIPKNWKIELKGQHNLENISCALEVGRLLGIEEGIMKKAVENFASVPGRMELVKSIRGIDIYNDTNSCTPEATIAALETLGNENKNIILIVGGSDKNLDFGNLLKYIRKFAKAVVLIPGNGTERIMGDLKGVKNVEVYEEGSLEEVVQKAYSLSSAGDTILYSPAFTSFGMFDNEYDRGEKFMKLVEKLK